MATNILLMQKIGKSFSYIVIATLVAITSLFALPIGVSASGALAFAGGSTINGLTDVYVPVTGLTLTGTSADPAIPVTLSVPRGQLSMTTTTGLTFTGSPTGSNLAFSGSQADINAALATLRYRTTRAETVQLTATLTSPGVVYFPGNGHMYEVIDHGSGISWDDAKVAAEGLTKNGAQGYLATITSQAENDYLLGKLIGDGWFGASDAQTEDDWKWVTGPEAGTSFWQGLGDGSPVGGLFSNWASGEPNNAGNEDCAQFYSSGSGWNDLPCDGPYLNYYVVEYGTDGALPVAPSSTTSTITTSFPTPDDIDISSCLDLIDVADNAGDHRYDNLSLAGDIDCNGEVLSPLFNETDPDLGTMGFRGTFDGNGHTISNITVDANADNTGFIANTDGATIRDLSINGQVKGGDNCTGGLVGSALNTVFDNVDVNVDVTSYATYSYRMGGIVGCLDTDTDSSSVENSSALGSVTGYAYLGGIVGAVTGNAGGTTTMTGNTSNVGIIASSGYSIGGAAGRVDVEDEDTLVTLAGNTTMGVSASDSYTVGGLVGEADADDGAKIEFTQNTIGGNVEAGGRAGGLIGGAYVYDGAQVTASNFHFIYGTTANNSYAGGIVGEVNAEGSSFDTKFVISSSSVSGAVNADSNAGGLIGEIDWDYGEEDLLVTNSHVSGDVTSSNGDAGGIASSAHGLRIANSYTTGVIVSGGAAGGLIGEAGDTQVSESYATGNVTSTSDGVGGLVGKNGNNAQITESYATGNVEGNSRVGGIVGANGNGAVVRDAYARGNVSGDSNVGGVAGRCGYGSLENVYATGAVTGPVTTGGVLGQNSGSCTIVDSFWDTQTTGLGTSAAGATSKTSVQMKSKSTFTTVTTGLVTPWNFTTIWGVNGAINNGYPCLLWQASECGDSDDGDNVSNVMEGNAPNNGDANNDGTVDSEQSNVASFVNNVTQDYTSLEVDQVCGLTSVSSAAESSNAKSDAVYTYQNGLVGFTANCGTPGYTSTIKQYYYGAQLSPGMVLRKYNPTTQTYFTVEDATLSSVTVDGRSAVMVVYTITDGGNLDVDGVQNGVIVDPVGIATLTGTGELASTGERQGIFVGAAVALVSVAGLALGGVLVVSIRKKHRLHRR